jgi:hypothetical protein
LNDRAYRIAPQALLSSPNTAWLLLAAPYTNRQ